VRAREERTTNNYKLNNYTTQHKQENSFATDCGCFFSYLHSPLLLLLLLLVQWNTCKTKAALSATKAATKATLAAA